ncbi:TadE/TadG family type IV pilus assembly protein [Nocardioides sp. 1609]|uniref:TadE/TadG family type IV pilus assembly protein n=1 Tax=Nocardioides sp. 1609 TaxID=2508327 RepID=UPI00106FF8F9|nr:TadE/TadG family type IV pilus assembly protein [Nocardioides sp. 1609]
MRTTGPGRGDRGAAAVEFALVVVPLLYLVFGVIEYGYMLSVRQAISQAAAEGARAAAVTTGDPQTAARAAVTDALSGYSLVCEAGGHLTSDSQIVGECTVGDPAECVSGTAEAECVRLTLAYDYEPLVGFGFGFLLPDRLVYTTDVQVG